MKTNANPAPEDRKLITLLDGRRVLIRISGENYIKSDTYNHIFDFSNVDTTIKWYECARDFTIGVLQTYSSSHAYKTWRTCQNFAEWHFDNNYTSRHEIQINDVDYWLRERGFHHWHRFRRFLQYYTTEVGSTTDTELYEFVRDPEMFEEKHGGRYFALVVNDPERGALTEKELRSVQESVNRAYERGVLTLKEWALAWFLIGTGVRPVQIARMKWDDIKISDGPEGLEVTLNIPLAKGRSAGRIQHWKRKAPSVLSDVLIRYHGDRANVSSESDFLFEQNSSLVTKKLLDIFSRLDTYSERLEGPIPLFAYRFRYTLATRALALGASDHEVARLLTHRSVGSIRFYRAALPMIQRPIADAIGPELTYIAQAFQGRLIDDLTEASRRGDSSALIRDFADLVGQSLGACGTTAKCHQNAPRACLSCRKFEPFRAAPWEELLKVLEDDLAAETEDRIKLITAQQIEAVHGIIINRDTLNGKNA